MSGLRVVVAGCRVVLCTGLDRGMLGGAGVDLGSVLVGACEVEVLAGVRLSG